MSRARIVSRDVLAELAAQARAVGEVVVMTNGCFDLLHAGHVRYLEAAARHGDHLFVAVNSDASVRALKGPSRPLVPELQRAELIAALRVVSRVTIFPEHDAIALLRCVQPQLYVKGGDYRAEQIPERACLHEWGARLLLLDGLPEVSSSALIARARADQK